MAVCVSCRYNNIDLAHFCQKCGTPIPQAETPPAEEPTARIYGGFWIRALAFLIDWIVVGFASVVVAGIAVGPGFFVGLAIPWLYEALMLSSEHRATLGKIALGLIVTDADGRQLTFGRATGRHFAKYLSAFVLGIGFIIAAFTARKQALHDLIAETLVLRR